MSLHRWPSVVAVWLSFAVAVLRVCAVAVGLSLSGLVSVPLYGLKLPRGFHLSGSRFGPSLWVVLLSVWDRLGRVLGSLFMARRLSLSVGLKYGLSSIGAAVLVGLSLVAVCCRA